MSTTTNSHANHTTQPTNSNHMSTNTTYAPTQHPSSKMTDASFQFAELHEQLEQSNAFDVLGIDHGAPLADVRAAYRRLAVQIHPDKCPEELQELHTALFQNLQEAYIIALAAATTSSPVEECETAEELRLTEDPLRLHQRILDFRATLAEERKAAVAESKRYKLTLPGSNKLRRAATERRAAILHRRAAARDAAIKARKLRRLRMPGPGRTRKAAAEGSKRTSKRSSTWFTKHMKRGLPRNRDCLSRDFVVSSKRDALWQTFQKWTLSAKAKCISLAEKQRRDNNAEARELQRVIPNGPMFCPDDTIRQVAQLDAYTMLEEEEIETFELDARIAVDKEFAQCIWTEEKEEEASQRPQFFLVKNRRTKNSAVRDAEHKLLTDLQSGTQSTEAEHLVAHKQSSSTLPEQTEQIVGPSEDAKQHTLPSEPEESTTAAPLPNNGGQGNAPPTDGKKHSSPSEAEGSNAVSDNAESSSTQSEAGNSSMPSQGVEELPASVDDAN